MIKKGYAKPNVDVFCENLPLSQKWNLSAKKASKGLYKIVDNF
jgi:hypothetical protein